VLTGKSFDDEERDKRMKLETTEIRKEKIYLVLNYEERGDTTEIRSIF